MELNTKRVLCILGAVEALDLAIGTGQLKITGHMIPEAFIPAVTDWAAFFAFVISIIMTAITGGSWATDTSVPVAPKPSVGPAAAVALVIGLGVALSMIGSDTAQAQIRKPQVTGNIIEDIKANNAAGVTPGQGLDATWAKIKDVSIADIAYAKALADAIGTPRSKIRSTCYAAWIKVVQQSQGLTAGDGGKPLGPMPDPSLFSHFEQAVEVVDNLQPDSEFMVACQPAANLLKQSILQFVTSAVGGVTSLGALGVGIP